MTYFNNNNSNIGPRKPRRARGGIKARSESGEFARNWWARRWIDALEQTVSALRLQRGQRYARLGQVMQMEEVRGGVNALVQGTRPQPYKVTLRIAPFNDSQWEKVLDVLGSQAIFAAQLLAGEMPMNIEEAFSAAGVSLFPIHAGDLVTDCSCPDKANPCKHVAAAHYILGDRFDEDPFLIFRLRGRTQEQILAGLRARRGGTPSPMVRGRRGVRSAPPTAPEIPERIVPLWEEIDHFWEWGSKLEGFEVAVHLPEIEFPLLKRLGEPEVAGGLLLEDTLGETYKMVSQFAVAMGYMGGEAPPPAEEDAG